MAFPIYFCKSEFNRFIRRNAVKIILSAVIAVIICIIALNRALTYESFCDYFEKNKSSILCYFRGEKSIFSLVLTLIFSSLIFFALIILCSFNDITALCSFIVIIFKVYRSIYLDVIIFKFCGISALIYSILHFVIIALHFFILSCACCTVVNSSNRYRYGLGEIVGCSIEVLPVLMLSLCLCIVECVVIFVGAIFI